MQKLKLRLQKIAPRPFVTVSLSFYFFISPFPRILAPPPLIFFSRNVKCTFKLFWRVFNLNKALMRIMFYFCRDLRKWKKFSDDLGKIKSKHFEKQKKTKIKCINLKEKINCIRTFWSLKRATTTLFFIFFLFVSFRKPENDVISWTAQTFLTSTFALITRRLMNV